MRILVTGGAGFIGSHLVQLLLGDSGNQVCVVDALTYAGSEKNLAQHSGNDNFEFRKIDIRARSELVEVFQAFRPEKVVHLAAETHVDRSISGPANFVETNILGTFSLLETIREYLQSDDGCDSNFRLVNVSTDEVFGSLGKSDPAFDENSRFSPRSPYAATKASADHLVRAWGTTFELPWTAIHGSNNYGPRQYPEKLIPLVIRQVLSGQPIPIYGDGSNQRDWIFVDDFVEAIKLAMDQRALNESYVAGGECEMSNLQVVERVCSTIKNLQSELPQNVYAGAGQTANSNIRFVDDRPGHDFRYALDNSKIRSELGWSPRISFEDGLSRTVLWYLKNPDSLKRS